MDLLRELGQPGAVLKGEFEAKRSLYPVYTASRCRLCKHREAHLQQLADKKATRA